MSVKTSEITGNLVPIMASEGAQTAPEEIVIWPQQVVSLRQGRGKFRLDNAEQVLAASLKDAAGNMLPIDIDHGMNKIDEGQSGQAVGWIGRLRAEGGQVLASVEWTANGRQLVEGGAYRFVSPTFLPDKAGRVVRFLRVALTNIPAIQQMEKIASEQESVVDETQMAALRAALGLTADADGAAIVLAAEQQKKALTGLTAAGQKIVTLSGGADNAEITAAAIEAAGEQLASQSPDPGAFVPREMFDGLKKQVTELTEASAADKAERLVTAAVEAGKIPPAQVDWALKYARSGLADFQKFVENQPVLASNIPNKELGGPASDPNEITASDREIMNMTGVSEEAFTASKKELAE